MIIANIIWRYLNGWLWGAGGPLLLKGLAVGILSRSLWETYGIRGREQV